MANVAVIGAGLAGLAAALGLSRNGLSVTVFEASPRVGGRLSTRERGPVRFDDGAQFIRTATDAASELILHELPANALNDIRRDVLPFDRRGRIGPGDPAQNGQPKWAYAGGLATLPGLLREASGATVRLGWPVRALERSGSSWSLHGPGGVAAGFDAVIITLPPAAAGALSRGSLPALAPDGAFGPARHRSIISVAFEPVDPPAAPHDAYALVNTDRKHAISWLAFESAKAGHVPPGHEVLVAQMAHAWSAPRLASPAAEVARDAVAACGNLLGTALEARWSHVTYWREALPDTLAIDANAFEDACLFLAGDAFSGGRVGLAIETGLAAAGRVARRLDAHS